MPFGNVDPLAGLQATDTTPTASVAGGGGYDTGVPVRLEGPFVTFAVAPITGAVVSRTSTEKLDEAVLVAASDARHDTVVVPTGKVEPLDGVHETDVTPTASVADGSAKVTAAPAALVASATMPAGVAIAGAVTSLTVTLNDAVAVLPAESFAVQVTTVEPTLNDVPLAGVQVCDTTPTASVAAAL